MAQKEKVVTRSEIRRVIGDYIRRMLHSFETMRGMSTDGLIQCPSCGCFGMECGPNGWNCLVTHCQYRFPEETFVPSPSFLESYYKRKKQEGRMDNLLKSLGIEI